MNFTTGGEPRHQPSTIRLGSANVTKDPAQNGVFVAIDVDTNKREWTYHAAQPLIAGALTTVAPPDSKLWKFTLAAGANAAGGNFQTGYLYDDSIAIFLLAR